MEKKTIKSSDIFQKKVLYELNNGHKVGKFIVEYINEKSYGSYRTFAKRLKEVVAKLSEDGHISASELNLINIAIKQKVSNREPDIIFDFDSYLSDYINLLEVYKEQYNHPLNTLFLSLPFLLTMGLKEMKEIRICEIQTIDLSNGILIKYKSSAGDLFKNIKIEKYYNEWVEIFDLIKKHSASDNELLLSSDIMISHTVFNQKVDAYLAKYAPKNSSGTKFYTLLRNCMKYASHFCSIV